MTHTNKITRNLYSSSLRCRLKDQTRSLPPLDRGAAILSLWKQAKAQEEAQAAAAHADVTQWNTFKAAQEVETLLVE